MREENKIAAIQLLEKQIIGLRAEYARLLKESGKFNELKGIKIKLRAAENQLNPLR